MSDTKKYPFAKGDIVASKQTDRKGVVLSVGQIGHSVTALVTWFDTELAEHVDVNRLKKSLRPIDGGK
jgi:hypothetical protein